MPDCDYCENSYADEEKYIRHLKSEHEDELGRVDQRRVGSLEPDEGGYDTGVIVLGIVIFGGLLVSGAVAAMGSGLFSGSGADGPHGTTHEHGLLQVEIDGEALNFENPEFRELDRHFHFHGSDRVDSSDWYVWHTHSHGVSIQYALETLGIAIDDDGTELSFDGETYRDDDPETSVEVTVNGEPVEPAAHELGGVGIPAAQQGQGDDVRVVVDTDS